MILARSLHKRAVVRRERCRNKNRWLRVGRGGRRSGYGGNAEKGMDIMGRVLGIAKMIGSLFAIELFVPGGTLIVLAFLVAGRPGSPLQQRIARRFPVVFKFVSGLAGNAAPSGGAVGHS